MFRSSWNIGTPLGLLLLAFSMASAGLSAQNTGALFSHYSIKNGLIMNNVEYVYIDHEGFVWLGTYAGLQRFDGYEFKDYTYEPGNPSSISDNFISTIFEDDLGNLWIGTSANGLNVFNKENETFRTFRHEPGNPNSLASNSIPRASKIIVQDADGYVWVNTQEGLNRIDIRDFSFETYFGDLAGQLVFDKQESVLWIAGERLKKFDLRNQKLKYYDTGPVHSIILDSRGWIWLGTESGVRVLDKQKDRLLTLGSILVQEGFSNLNEVDWNGGSVNHIYEDLRGNIWMGVREKLIILNWQEKRIEILAHEPDNDNSPTGTTISGIYGNKSGVIWITYLNQGVSKVNINLKKFIVFRNIPGDPNSLGGNTVRSVFLDKRRVLWVGTYEHGLDRINLRNDRYTHFRHNSGDPSSVVDDYITALLVDDRERLWIGSFNRGICYADHIYDPGKLKFTRVDLLSDMEIHEITQDPAGRIWISTQNGLYLFDGEKFSQYGVLPGQVRELREMNVQSVVVEPPNVFWLATWNSGLCRLVLNSDRAPGQVPGNDVLEKYDRMQDQYSMLIDNKFITIHRDDAGNLWLGSFLNGLIRVVENEGGLEFIRYDKSAGAPDNSIYGLTSDHSGDIWLSTNHGLGRFDPETEQFRNYYLSDGLQSNSFMWDAFFRSPDGQLFFGGINGLNAFYPDDIVDNLELPEVFISKLIINNEIVRIGDEFHGRTILSRDIRYTDAITLSHREPVFSLEFTAMDNINPWEVMYRYRLQGFDNEWVQTDAGKRNVRYTNLNPGSYSFQVKASNSDGIWNEVPATLTITIKPPLWQTWWAILGYSLVFALLLLAFRRLVLGRAQLIHEARVEHLEREKTEEMYQMKLRFFTSISHEFRTPLTLILGPLYKIVRNLEKDKRFSKEIMTIKRNSDRLFRLIDQVIEFRKIETNTTKLQATEKDVVSFVRELVDSFEELACQRSISLEYNPEFEQKMLWFDENKLDKIVYNLLSNAFKYTADKGKITVRLSKADTVPGTGRDSPSHEGPAESLQLSVEDTGIGIPDKDLEHIFDRFFRVDHPDSFIKTGSGIGLALARELTELHRGSISVTSKLGKGSCFTVLLPCGREHLSDDEIVDRSAKEGPDASPAGGFILREEEEYLGSYENVQPGLDEGDRPLLLIVDDDPELRDFIKNNFSENFIVIEAENGEEGFDMALKNNPDIIVSDILMPVMDGIELCKKIKSDIKTSHIPLIMLTAKANIESRIEGLDTGADAYISKPFTVKLIEVQINNILESRKRLRRKFSREFILQPSEITITSLDATFLQKAINTVEKHISDTDFSVDAFIREMGMSRSRMHRKLTALTEQSTSEFIRTIRLKRAAVLLEKSQMSIEETAYSVGFNSTAYFAKCFKIQFGKTPSEYLRSKHEQA